MKSEQKIRLSVKCPRYPGDLKGSVPSTSCGSVSRLWSSRPISTQPKPRRELVSQRTVRTVRAIVSREAKRSSYHHLTPMYSTFDLVWYLQNIRENE